MSWFWVAVVAYLMLAIVNLLDKFLVSTILKSSQAYAFIACLLGSLVFLVAPWFLHWPGTALLLWDLVNGAIFAVALWLLYEALLRGEAARTLVFIGGMTPVFSLLFSVLLFKEQFSPFEWLGIGLILLGVFIISALPTARSYLARVFHKLNLYREVEREGLGIALLSALAYSLYFLSTKQAYQWQPFVSAFIWTRLGASLFVLLFLIKDSTRRAIVKLVHHTSPNKHKFLVIFNQGCGSLGFILQNYAIFLGSVVLVNALQGVQYAFLLIISAVLAGLAPKLLKENFSWRIFLQKTLAIAIIALGLYFIAI
jgi:drug/metabolite transporter (DMT)-like permease